jgi:hypothetical protein
MRLEQTKGLTMYIIINNNTPKNYSIGQLLSDNPGVSFPQNIPDEVLAEYGIYPVTQLPEPDYDPKSQQLKQSEYYQTDTGWQVHYTIEQLPSEQVSQTVRNIRDRLLQASDWVVSRSYERQQPVPESWATYREALRDVPQQAGFPYNVQWPSIN